MRRIRHATAVLSLVINTWFTSTLVAQQPKTNPAVETGTTVSEERAFSLAEQGRCAEALSALKRVLNGQRPAGPVPAAL